MVLNNKKQKNIIKKEDKKDKKEEENNKCKNYKNYKNYNLNRKKLNNKHIMMINMMTKWKINIMDMMIKII